MGKARNPVLEIRDSPFDHLIKGLGWILLALLIILPLIFFGQLPDKVPMHFNFRGVPDAYHSKWFIFSNSLVAGIIFFSLGFLIRRPHLLNYPVKVTLENARRQYIKMRRFLRFLNLIVLAIFLYLTIGVLRISLGKEQTLGSFSLLGILTVITITLILYLWSSHRRKPPKSRDEGDLAL